MPAAFGTGFIAGLTQAAQKQIDQKHQEEEALKKEKRDMYWGIAYDTTGKYSDAQKQAAQQELGKLVGPQSKKGIQKFGDIFGRLTKAQRQQQPAGNPGQHGGELLNGVTGAQQDGAAQGQQGKLPTPQTPAPTPTGQDPATGRPSLKADNGATPGGAPASPIQAEQKLPTPKTPAPQPQQAGGLPPIQTNEEILKRQQAPAQADRDRRSKLAEQYKFTGPGALEFIETGKVPASLVKESAIDTLTSAIKASDPDLTDEDAKQQAGEIITAQAKKKSEETKTNDQKVYYKYPGDGPNDPPHLVWENAKTHSRIDASTQQPPPEGAKATDEASYLANIRRQSYGQYFTLVNALKGKGYSQEQAEEIAGNQIEDQMQKHLALMGAGSTREALGIGPGGESITIPLNTQKNPNQVAPLPPIQKPGQPQQAAPPASAPQGAPQAAPGKLPTPATPAQGQPPQSATPPVRSGQQGRALGAVSPSVARQASQFGIPITESVVQIFGDPNQPDVKSLSSFAKLADSEESSARIGKAIEITLSGFGDSIGEASIGAGAGPIHLSAGGFGTWLQNALGMPGKVAQQKADTIREIMKQMTPEEREAYDATMSELSVMAGLRSLSKSSAAMGSIKLIENEIPKIGVNVADSKQFADQLQKVAGAINNAVNNSDMIPKVKGPDGKMVPIGISPELAARISKLPGEMQALKKLPTPNGAGVKLPKPPKPGAKLSADDALKYMQANGGDRAKAEAAAKKDGWTF